MSRGKDHPIEEERIKANHRDARQRKRFSMAMLSVDERQKDIGLNVVEPPPDVEDLMWSLFEQYEKMRRYGSRSNPDLYS